MIYGIALLVAVIVGLGALRVYIRFDERRLAEQTRQQRADDES